MKTLLFSFPIILTLQGFIGVCTGKCPSTVMSVSEFEPLDTMIYEGNVYKLEVVSLPDSPGSVQAVQDGNKWKLILNGTLDAESPSLDDGGIYTVGLKCQPTKDVSSLIDLKLRIIVLDVDDHKVHFTQSESSVSIAEDDPVGNTIFTFKDSNKALDEDRGAAFPNYVLEKGGDGHFKMDNKQTGAITIIKALDYDSGVHGFRLNVSASTNKVDKAFAILHVIVTDVDDMNPDFSEKFYDISLPEDDTTTSHCYATVIDATDGDTGINPPATIAYELDGGSKELYPGFSFDSDKKSLCVKGPIERGTLSLNIKAYQKDQPTLRSSIAILKVHVTDINDHAPKMSETAYTASVSEGISTLTPILIVSATDEDEASNAKFAFHLTGANAQHFKIVTEGEIGLIYASTSLDRERNSHYTLQVYAGETDTPDSRNSSHSDVTIDVLDENDNNPSFTENSYTFHVAMNESVGHLVGKVNAKDTDDDVNGHVTYSLPTEADLFAIDAASGDIKTNRVLTLQDVGNHRVLVVASDNPKVQDQTRRASTQITIEVEGVNLYQPAFNESGPVTFNVTEGTTIGYFIGQLEATDADGDSLQYSISSDRYVWIGANGQLFLKTTPDLDVDNASAEHSFKITASDGIHTTSIDATLRFIDANEFSPQFNIPKLAIVHENATANTKIVAANATDKDKGEDGRISYSLLNLNGDASDLFKIESSTGFISLTCSRCLDYSIKTYYLLFVKAVDNGVPPRASTTTMGIEVLKTKYAKPTFSQAVFTFSTPENGSSPAVIGRVYATDSDTPASRLRYSLDPTNDPASNWITVENTGTIKAKTPFDAEALTQLKFNISVTDGHSSAIAETVIDVRDINEFTPHITLQPVTADVTENASQGTFVARVSASDDDVSNEGFTLWLGDGADGKFVLDEKTGDISVNGHFDRKVKQSYSIPVYVSDHGQPPFNNSATLEVRITSSNSAPLFQPSHYNFNVSEDNSLGHSVGSLKASDSDTGSSGRFSFSIESGNEEGVFSLDDENGDLTLSRELNFEDKSVYTLTVIAKDESYDPKTGTATVVINVKNVLEAPIWPSELPPVFLTQPSSCPNASLAQDPPTEVTKLTASGDDGVTYHLDNVTGDLSINVSTGVLLLTKTSVQAGTYVIGLKACNRDGSRCSRSSLTINVQMDDALAFCPSFHQRGVKESEPTGFTVLEFIINREKAGVVFSISDGGDGRFALDTKTGVLTVASPLDRENVKSYLLLVSAKSQTSGKMAEAQVLITVEDVNDEPPTFSKSLYAGRISEGAHIGTLVAEKGSTDPLTLLVSDQDENSKISLSIDTNDGGYDGAFAIHQDGSISLLKDVNFEDKPAYIFTVIASDGENSATTNVSVEVIDENDNSPAFNSSSFKIEIPEDTTTPSAIITLIATDKDRLDKGRIKYSLEMVRPPGVISPFTVSLETGVIVLQRPLDREAIPSFTVRVDARDSSGKMANTSLTVEVTDVNDNDPKFEKSHSLVNVTEGSTDATVTLKATDDDEGENGLLHFAITNPKNYSKFKLVSRNNEVTLTQIEPLDRESKDISRFIQVTASDNGTPKRFGSCIVELNVIDVNDETPTMKDGYTAEVLENSPNNTFVLQVTAEDRDGPGYGKTSIRFSISPTQAAVPFRVDPETGNIYVSLEGGRKLDYETRQSYVFNVIASDGMNSATTKVSVDVIDENDNNPVFNSSNFSLKIPEDTTPPSDVMTVTATDEDMLDKGQIKYSLEIVHPPGVTSPFTVSLETGVIILQRPLDREDIPSYTFRVDARDSSGKMANTSLTVEVTDVNDNDPKFEKSHYLVNVTEGSTDATVTLKATDDDEGENGRLHFDITSPKNYSKFKLVSRNNEVTLTQIEPLDRESKDISRFIQVTASDNGTLKRYGSCIVELNVIDVNDETPTMKDGYTAEVLENSPNNTFVLQVTAEDRDGPGYGKTSIRFSISPTQGAVPFRVNPETGNIYVSLEGGRKLDYETRQNYVFSVTATDHYGKGKQSQTVLRIDITDLNDVAPHFSRDVYVFHVSETSPSGSYVGNVTAGDIDTVGRIYYYMQGHAPFNLNTSNGHLTTIGQLHGERGKSYSLTVFATDSLQEDEAKVIIDVISCPSWIQSSLFIKVKETVQVGRQIGQLKTNDNGSPEDFITFYANDTAWSDTFNITSTGAVILKADLDADTENRKQIVIDVFARDEGSPPCVVSGELRVTVEGSNDNGPVICFQDECGVEEIQLSVLDKLSDGAVIGLIKARDNDTGRDGQTTFHLNGPSNVLDYFDISLEGTLTLSKALNLSEIKAIDSFVADGTVSFIVNVTDGGLEPRSSSAVVNVTIVATTSNIPLFKYNLYAMEVPENQQSGAFVGQVSALSESGGKVEYSLLRDSNVLLPFRINSSSGEILTTALLNREKQDRYQFIAVAKHQNNMYSALSLVKVNVTDLNDNYPVFKPDTLTWKVKEGELPVAPLSVHANDADEGENGTVTYAFVTQTKYFEINSSNGTVSLLQALDREETSQLTLVVKASDGGSPKKTSTLEIAVVVVDANDEAPVFHPTSHYKVVFTATPDTDTLILQINASDADTGNNGLVLYSLDRSDIPFIIDHRTGDIFNVRELDARTYNFSVIATDLGDTPLSSTANVTVEVLQEKVTEKEVDFTLSNDTLTLFVGMVTGLNLTDLGLVITSENPQAVRISGGNEDGVFAIKDGHLYLENPLTRDALYRLELKTGNNSRVVITKQLEVRVLSLQFYQPLYEVAVMENSTAPLSLYNLTSPPQAHGIPVIYSLQDTHDRFRIDPSSGELLATRILDREHTSLYRLTVLLRLDLDVLTAGGRRKRKADSNVAMTTVLVRVEDVNDNAPTFGVKGSKLTFSIPTNINSGYLITTIKAFDADEGLNQMIQYSITDGQTPALTLGETSGQLRVDNLEEFQRSRHLALTVKAQDKDGLSGEQLKIEIDVQDDSHESHLVASISLSDFHENKDVILSNLSTILGYRLKFQSTKLYEKDSIVYTDSTEIVIQAYEGENATTLPADMLEGLIKEHQAEITSLFESFKKSKMTPSSSNDDTASIALISIGSVMLVASLIAVLVVVHQWNKQKHYQKREQNAKRARENMDKDKDTESVDIASDPDEHLELDIDLDDSSIFGSNFLSKQPKDFPTHPSGMRIRLDGNQGESETSVANGHATTSNGSVDIESGESALPGTQFPGNSLTLPEYTEQPDDLEQQQRPDLLEQTTEESEKLEEKKETASLTQESLSEDSSGGGLLADANRENGSLDEQDGCSNIGFQNEEIVMTSRL